MKLEYLIAAVAGEGQEIDLPANIDAAVLTEVREFRGSHQEICEGPQISNRTQQVTTRRETSTGIN